MNSSAHQLFRQQTIGKKKRERTRGALLDSAISVFANKGYEGTRISDITAHADVANGTFYNYYQDKDQLLHDVALGLAVEITGRINEEMSDVTHAPTRGLWLPPNCCESRGKSRSGLMSCSKAHLLCRRFNQPPFNT